VRRNRERVTDTDRKPVFEIYTVFENPPLRRGFRYGISSFDKQLRSTLIISSKIFRCPRGKYTRDSHVGFRKFLNRRFRRFAFSKRTGGGESRTICFRTRRGTARTTPHSDVKTDRAHVLTAVILFQVSAGRTALLP